MLKYFERAMAMIGVIATVIGTVISYRAFIKPAELSQELMRIADRLGREPILDENERIYVAQVLKSSTPGGSDIGIYMEKQLTNAPGSLELQICDPVSGALLGSERFSFGRETADFYPQFELEEGTEEIDLILSAKIGQSSFSRKEEWKLSNGNWARSSEPKIASGAQSCQ